ncbi:MULTISPECIES: DHA2 family efflux MFS transporter permease subunit [unclassified Streptomyces]|uniref:DHA2 family efflux MFS transporter permease subunit n=1 Tax=unclassified Streptomyces TaxID=2593676 RepID=UPI00225A0492|nr:MULTISPECIES: DHA2 family efflux MFS transporter permease subunit [unclassified Streptomyces]MCX4626459.1 DHA2 family efflux MFS transporter permease subunit [Streptomyces sp. NBC_01443]WSW42660.1 DHA2 family efflux MFS transporter permease subunit [Streptomyces sp. NBC_01001]
MSAEPTRPGTSTTSAAPDAAAQPDPRRWWILAVIGLAQLMVVLDATIVNIALPSAQADLGFSDDQRQWVVTAYAITFGSLLLLGGRLADLFGRRRAFLIGQIGFAAASAVGGAAATFGVLVTARALQGVFAALLAPAALSLLTTTFSAPAERGKAFGVFGALAASGGAVGLLLGGFLTEHLSWRSTMYVNLLFAAVAVIGGVLLLKRSAPTTPPRLDLPGTVLASSGLFCLVYGLAKAGPHGWPAGRILGCLATGAVLLAAFVWWQRRSAHPLLPLRIVLDRVRGTALTSVFITGVGMFGVFLFLTYYFQHARGYSPDQTGLAFMPMSGCTMIGAIGSNMGLLGRIGGRPRIVTGMLLSAGGMAWLANVTATGPYVLDVLPGQVATGLGMGLITAAAMNLGTAGIDPRDAGVGSATVNAMRQIGGSVGTALMSALGARAVARSLAGRQPTPELMARAALEGYHTVFTASAVLFSAGAVLTLFLLPGGLSMERAHGAPGGRRPSAR